MADERERKLLDAGYHPSGTSADKGELDHIAADYRGKGFSAKIIKHSWRVEGVSQVQYNLFVRRKGRKRPPLI
jgi:hypothetical protein